MATSPAPRTGAFWKRLLLNHRPVGLREADMRADTLTVGDERRGATSAWPTDAKLRVQPAGRESAGHCSVDGAGAPQASWSPFCTINA
jgi:hypothetical protein